MYSKFIQLSILCCLVVLLFTFGTASAVIFLSENWDGVDNPVYPWPCQSIPTSCTNTANTFHGWRARSWDCRAIGGQTSGLSTSIYHSPPRSYHMVRQPHASYSCDLYKAIPEPHPTKIYFRAYVYLPSSVWNLWNYSRSAGDDNEHFVFFNSAMAGSSIRMDFADYSAAYSSGHYGCWQDIDRQMYLNPQNVGNTNFLHQNAPNPCFNFLNPANLDRWICLEWMFDLPNQLYALWIDGIQYVGTGGNGVPQPLGASDFYTVYLSLFRSGGEPYISLGAEYYIDDIVVSDSYIGPTGGGGGPPSPPRSLVIQGN